MSGGSLTAAAESSLGSFADGSIGIGGTDSSGAEFKDVFSAGDSVTGQASLPFWLAELRVHYRNEQWVWLEEFEFQALRPALLQRLVLPLAGLPLAVFQQRVLEQLKLLGQAFVWVLRPGDSLGFCEKTLEISRDKLLAYSPR